MKIIETIKGDEANADIFEDFSVRMYDADYPAGIICRWTKIKTLEQAREIVRKNLPQIEKA